MELIETIVTHQKCEVKKENEVFIDCLDKEKIDWIEIFRLYHETIFSTAYEDQHILRYFENTSAITSADPYLFITTYDKNINKSEIYGIYADAFLKTEIFLEDESIYSEHDGQPAMTNEVTGYPNNTSKLLRGIHDDIWNLPIEEKVTKTCLLNLPLPVLLIITASSLKASILPSSYRWPEKDTTVQLLDTKPQVKCNSKTSSDGQYLLTEDCTNGDYLLLYSCQLEEYNSPLYLNLTLLYRFKTDSPCYAWYLHKEKITTMETSGHIRIYQIREKISAELSQEVYLCAESSLKKDLRYPNPTVFYRNFIFSSTLISRDLLEYWHMDRDRDYWLVGELTIPRDHHKESVSRIDLHNINIAQDVCQTVTVVQYDRGLVLCGTKEGHVLGYKINFYRNNEGFFDFLSGSPYLHIPNVTSLPISRLGCLYTPLGLFITANDEAGNSSLLYIGSEI